MMPSAQDLRESWCVCLHSMGLLQAILLLEAAPAAAAPLLAKLHSNRAAARLMRHAPREALADCTAALQVAARPLESAWPGFPPAHLYEM